MSAVAAMHELTPRMHWDCLVRAVVIAAVYSVWGLACLVAWIPRFEKDLLRGMLYAGVMFFVGVMFVEFLRARRRAKETGAVFPFL